MKKFVAMYMAPAATIEQMMKATPAQMKTGMEEWTKWSKKNEKSVVDLGAPLGKTKRIASAGISDTKNEITGYSIVQGDSLESVAKLFKDHPHLRMGPGASVDLLEYVAIPGM